jgi:hypothetical protein
MRPLVKGLIIAAVHIALVASLGAKLLYDRATRPRVWARSAPYDPNLPIRGRYVSLQLAVEPRGVREPRTGSQWQPPEPVVMRLENNRLIGEALSAQDSEFNSSDLHVLFIERRGEKLAVLDHPIAYFIPEHIPDPSIRPGGEELWVEVTVPRKGPPRPIQLGVKKGDGPIVPLEIR